MRNPATLSATLAWLLAVQVASAEPSANAASANPPAPPPGAVSSPGSASPASAAPASTTGAPPIEVVPADPEQPPLEPIPDARDTLGGHFLVGAGAGAKWAFGSHSRALGTGLDLNLDLGFGISRYVVLGAWGEFSDYSAASGCGGCSGLSLAGGPFLRFHAVQGTRFDPWGSLAVGVRSSRVDVGDSRNHYFGPEIVKLSLGSDWYPTSKFALGPYVSFDVGTFDKSGHTSLGAGLRLVLNLPGK